MRKSVLIVLVLIALYVLSGYLYYSGRVAVSPANSSASTGEPKNSSAFWDKFFSPLKWTK